MDFLGSPRALRLGWKARALLPAMAVAAVAVVPSASRAAPPAGSILALQGATLISAVIPAPANATYASLLPGPVAPPAKPSSRTDPNRPSVKLTGLDITSGGASTFESYAMLRSRYCGRNGWDNPADGNSFQLGKGLGGSPGISEDLFDPRSGFGPTPPHPRV